MGNSALSILFNYLYLMKKIIIVFVAFFLIVSCAYHDDNQTTKNTTQKIITIDLDKAKQHNFYEIFDTSSIEYIQLESSQKSLIGETKRFYIIDDNFIFISNKKLVVFNQNGKFLYSIEKRGKGPGEYLTLDDVYIDNGIIFILDRQGQKIIKYNTNGEFLGTLNTGLYAESFAKLSEDIFCLYIGSNKNDASSYRMNYYSEKQKKIVHRALPITENEYKWMYFFDLNNFTSKDADLLFKYSFNDTIYSLNKHGLNPYILIDWEQYKLPDKIKNGNYSDILEFNNKTGGKYIFSTIGLFSTSTHLSFGFKLNDVMYQALYNWKDNSIKVISGISNLYSIGNSSVDFSMLPQASNGDFFYTLVEQYFISEIAKESNDLPIPFKKLDADKNPIIAKFKYHL